MKKTLLLLFMLSVATPFFSYGQTKRVNLLSVKVGTVDVKYIKSVDLEKNETFYTAYLAFQNSKYTSITDTKFIFFQSKSELETFLKDLNIIYKQMLLDEKINLSFDKENYRLTLYDFSPNLYLRNVKDVSGSTILSKRFAKELIDNLSQIDFGNDVLLKVE